MFKTLAELEAENPELFRNPIISDVDFDAMMARNRARAAIEDANALASDDEEDQDEENDED